ncbi:unnamed protein product [Closterium sp. NIES-54]
MGSCGASSCCGSSYALAVATDPVLASARAPAPALASAPVPTRAPAAACVPALPPVPAPAIPLALEKASMPVPVVAALAASVGAAFVLAQAAPVGVPSATAADPSYPPPLATSANLSLAGVQLTPVVAGGKVVAMDVALPQRSLRCLRQLVTVAVHDAQDDTAGTSYLLQAARRPDILSSAACPVGVPQPAPPLGVETAGTHLWLPWVPPVAGMELVWVGVGVAGGQYRSPLPANAVPAVATAHSPYPAVEALPPQVSMSEATLGQRLSCNTKSTSGRAF